MESTNNTPSVAVQQHNSHASVGIAALGVYCCVIGAPLSRQERIIDGLVKALGTIDFSQR